MLNEDWKKQYNSDMGRQTPSDKSMERLKGANMAKSSNNEPSKKSGIGIWAALAACIVLAVVVGVPFGMNYFKKETPPAVLGGTPVQSSKTMSYSEIYDVVSKLSQNDLYYAKGAGVKAAAPEAATANGTDGATRSLSTPDYSDTNIQVAGVQESDIVKTDGKYIYAITEKKLHIISAVDGNMSKVSELSCYDYDEYGQQKGYAFEMYITGNRLVLLKNFYDYSFQDTVTGSPDAKRYIMPPRFTKARTGVEIYDISDKASPKFITSYSQSGSYISSRMIENHVYIITNEGLYSVVKEDPTTFIPMVYKEDKGTLLAAEDIRISSEPADGYPAQYLVISGIDADKGELVSTKSVLGYGNNVYSSLSNLYISSYSQYKEDGSYTNATRILRFSIDNGKIEYKSEGTVKGSLLNQFSMDEHNEVLRVVTTVNSVSAKSSDGMVSQSYMYNCLYTLDLDLKTIGKLEDLASGERVYSVRFDGDTGYFVTFRQVDPLFTVDLSDPEKPEILSALKIPGFSQYLHPYADGLLFGLGRNADEQSGKADFLKLSMFDTSNPEDVIEANKTIVDGVYYSEASSNHKAILINKDKDIIAFPADGKYYIYSYSAENGFTEKAIVSLSPDAEKEPYYYYQNMRGLFIGGYLYIISDAGVSSFGMTDYKLFETLVFN